MAPEGRCFDVESGPVQPAASEPDRSSTRFGTMAGSDPKGAHIGLAESHRRLTPTLAALPTYST